MKIGGVKISASAFGKRAISAYYRSGGYRLPHEPVREYLFPDGKSFIVLTSEPDTQIIACYRHREDTDRLFALVRWPAVLDELVKRQVAA